MRFRPSAKPRLGNRRDQRRVVMLFGMFVIVIWSIFKTSNPRNWEWLTGPPPTRRAQSALTEQQIFEQQQALKEKLLTGATGAAPTTEAEKPIPKGDTAEVAPTVDRTAEADRDGAPTANEAAAEANTEANTKPLAQPPDYVISKGIFSNINENALNIRSSEAPAYWSVLATARLVSQTDLERVALKDITYAQVFSDPEFYRGQPLTIEGELLRFTRLPISQNQAGIETVYEGWLRNADSGKNPIVFHCLEKPSELSLGEKLSERIRVTGFFFKRYHYAAKSGVPHAAPLILAKRLQWFPVVERPVADPSWAPYLIGLLTVVGTLLSSIIVWTILREQRRSNSQFKRFVAPTTLDLDSFDPPAN